MNCKSELKNQKIILLGSTGSVGMQTLDVARFYSIPVEALCAGRNIGLLLEQIREFQPKYCGVADEAAAKKLKEMLFGSNIATKIIAGRDCAREIVRLCEANTVVNAIIGFAGLRPTLEAIERNKNVALANKETLVSAGEIVMQKAREKGVRIIPIDSEHCAVMQCLDGRNKPSKIILTASGGPFFGKTRADLTEITPEIALRHPTWNMGPKISIDSATLMNKGLEVIEAAHLFDIATENIDVLVHRQSIIHSMVEYSDKAVMAQLSVPDMRLCIQYALTCPQRMPSQLQALDLSSISALTFTRPDMETFKLLPLAYDAAKRGSVFPAVMNAANEAAVQLFLEKKIGFCDITDIVCHVTKNWTDIPKVLTVEEIEKSDFQAREKVCQMAKCQI